MQKIFSVKNLCKKYFRGSKEFFALENINLEINSEDFICIIGRSGSGKSTLLNIIAGMLTPSSGEIFFHDENFITKNDLELSKIRNEKIGFIPQGASALENLTVLENVMLPYNLYRNSDCETSAKNLLSRFGILNLANSYPKELSGGELRRALIARALINNPEIIIADEPVSDLDFKTADEVMKIFVELNSEGVALLIVSHDLDGLKYSKSVYEMKDGVLSETKNAVI